MRRGKRHNIFDMKPKTPIKQRLEAEYQRGFADGKAAADTYLRESREAIEHNRKIALIDARTKAINASGQAMDAVQKALQITLSSHQ